jgi:putative heme-binding domain-containing protein
MKFLVLALACSAALGQNAVEAGRGRFNVRCAGCHGQDGLGGERAPAIGHAWRSRMETDAAIRDLIRQGIPESGMPGFNVPDAELDQLLAFVRSRVTPLNKTALAGDAKAGEALFFGSAKCAECHMVQGRGSVRGPDLTEAGKTLTLAEAESTLHDPNSRRADGYRVATVQLRSGEKIRGFVRNESSYDLQLQGFDQRLHLLRKKDVASVDREPGSLMPAWKGTPAQANDLIAFVAHASEWKPSGDVAKVAGLPDAVGWEEISHPKTGEWPTYHGNENGNRYTELAQITPANVSRLAPPLGLQRE